MKRITVRSWLPVFLTATLAISSCKKETPVAMERANAADASNDIVPVNLEQMPDIKKLADTLAFRLRNSTVGYSFSVSYKTKLWEERFGGDARSAFMDPPWKPFTNGSRYSTASVSKTITAAALIAALNKSPNFYSMIDWPMYTYLPKHWQLGPNIKTITFRQLLTHTSGFRNPTVSDGNKCNYNDLKVLVANGVMANNQGVASYNNRNYALMRLLIPMLAKYKITNWDPNVYYPYEQPTVEGIQAKEFADAYKDWCHKTIFDKMPVTSYIPIDCYNGDPNPPLYYAAPGFNVNGSVVPDLSLSAGGQGWVMTSGQMCEFFRTLHYTENILPKLFSDFMKTQLLGYDVAGTTKDKVSYYWKNGKYDNAIPATSMTPCFRSLLIGFGDDIQISILANSPINLEQTAIAAHEDWKQ